MLSGGIDYLDTALTKMNSSHEELKPIVWSDSYALGYEPMDIVHEEFVALVRAMQEAPDNELLTRLDAIAEHAKSHFGAENDWMAATDFPARECHVNEHDAVLKSVLDVRTQLVNGDLQNARRLADELARWFSGHTNYLDSALAHWMCKLRLGGKPLVFHRRINTN